MYLDPIPENHFTTTLVRIKYDCPCGHEHTLKWKDADKNFQKNGGKHICRKCTLRTNNPFARPDVKEKIKKTNLERYGVEKPANTPENIAKRVDKMFGTEESTQKIVEKRKQTSRERYGADHIMQTDEGVRRVKAAMQDKYGVDFPLQSKEILEKKNQTCLERYGVDNVMKLDEVKEKVWDATEDRHGVKHYNQLPEMREWMRQNCPEWLESSWKNPWAKGKPKTESQKERQSKTMVDKIINGDWEGGGGSEGSIRGYYTSTKCRKEKPFFRSHLELIVHFFLDENDEVKWYDYEPFFVNYNHCGSRKYIPDFLIGYKNSIVVVEAKPAYRIAENSTKFDACREFASQQGMSFEIWDERKIHPMCKNWRELLTHERVQLLD
jgi:hypothetical protein